MNRQLEAPTFRTFNYGDDLKDKPLRGLDVLVDGTLVVQDIEGITSTYALVNVAPCFRLVAQIRKVISFNGVSSGAPTGLVGLH